MFRDAVKSIMFLGLRPMQLKQGRTRKPNRVEKYLKEINFDQKKQSYLVS